MRITTQQGFITNSSSTVYLTLVIGVSMEEFRVWLDNVAGHSAEDLSNKDICNQTLEILNEELSDYGLGEFLVDTIDLNSYGLTSTESELLTKLAAYYDFNNTIKEEDIWITSCLNSDGKLVGVTKDKKKYFGKILKAFYTAAAKYYAPDSYYVLSPITTGVTEQPSLMYNGTIDDGDEEQTSRIMLVALVVYAHEHNLPLIQEETYE